MLQRTLRVCCLSNVPGGMTRLPSDGIAMCGNAPLGVRHTWDNCGRSNDLF
jgi:hypothetical protein